MAAESDSVLAPLAAAAERTGIADFLRWWRGELAALLPAAWRERLASRDVVYLFAQGDEWRVYRPVAGRLAQSGQSSLSSLDLAGRRNVFRRLLAEEPGGAGNVWFVLPPEGVLIREVSLPIAAEEALRDAVGFDLDRLTPFSAEQAWFDYRVKGRDAHSQRLSLTLAVAARAPVEARLAEVREYGAALVGVGVMDDVAAAPTPLNLLPPHMRDRPAKSKAAIAARVLAAVAAVLALAAMVYPLWLKREAVIALHPRMESAKAGAQVTERVAQELEKIATAHNFVVARKLGQQPVVALLEDLSRLLPDTTWVQQLDVKTNQKAREVQIAGETGSSSQLIEVLEQSGSFANAGFKSPLTKGFSPGTERFLLSAEIKPRALPDPIPESALVTPGAGLSPSTPAQLPAAPLSLPPEAVRADTPARTESSAAPAAVGGAAASPVPETVPVKPATPAGASPARKG